MFGIYLFVIGLLTLMHWEFVTLNNGNRMLFGKKQLKN